MSATWYRWGDATFAEATDPTEIVMLDAAAAVDEREGSFFWNPQASFQFSDYRNDGIDPVKLADVQARTQGVLAGGEVIASATASASFDTRRDTLIVNAEVVPVDMAPLSLQLTDSPAGFEVVSS